MTLSSRFWRDRAWWMRWFAPLGALVVSVLITARAHLHYLFPYATPVSNDEGYISAFAIRLIQGHWLPYVDAISQRGPVLYWIAAVAMKIGGIFSWVPIRLLALTMGLSTVALTFLVALEFFTPMAAALASLAVTYLLNYELNPWDGVGYNGEIVAMQFVLASFLAISRAQRGPTPRRDRWIVAAGVLGALAGLSKQVTLIHMAPVALWLAIGRADVSESLRDRRRDLARYLAGFAVPYALVLGVYTLSGHLGDFIYYYQRHGREIFMAPVTGEYMREKIREQIDKYFFSIAGFSAMGFYALARALKTFLEDPSPGLARWRAHAPSLFTVAQFALAAFGASFTWRFFPHYFVQVHPIAALVAGMTFAPAFTPAAPAEGDDEPSARRRTYASFVASIVMVTGASLLLFVSASALGRNVRLRRETDRWYQDPGNDPIVRYVLERSSPSRPLFVWGFRAETYVSARRVPASRFVYTVYPSGVVPWFQSTREEEERRVVPGSREQLLRDLEATRPELVVDAGRSMNGRYMYNYPALRSYLDRNYCFMRYVDGEPVYRRREGEHCPPADY